MCPYARHILPLSKRNQNRMTHEEFEARAQQIYNDCERDASLNGGLGHAAMDALMEDCLREARYIAGLEIFNSLRHICY